MYSPLTCLDKAFKTAGGFTGHQWRLHTWDLNTTTYKCVWTTHTHTHTLAVYPTPFSATNMGSFALNLVLWDSLVHVGGFAELFNGHGLLLDVVLCEQSWLASDHLLNGSRNHKVIDVIVCFSGLPSFRWNYLSGQKQGEVMFRAADTWLKVKKKNSCKS